MSALLIKGCRVYQEGKFQEADLLIEEGRFTAIGPKGTLDGRMPAGCTVLEQQGKLAVPGFIDIHTHGGAGVDVNAADEEGFRTLARFFASQGVTAFQASVLTDTEEVTRRCLAAAQTVQKDEGLGAQLLGIHLEGPFLSKEYKGAMPEYLLREGDAEYVRRLMKDHPGVIRYMTVSPEVPGMIDMIEQLKDELTIAIGHSGADYDTAMRAIHAGARCVTHTMNAMRPMDRHEPAIAGAALESDCWCEAICDGRHLHPGMIRLFLKCKGWDRVLAITDSIMAAGLPDGEYRLGVNRVVVRDGDARIPETDTRAGSTLTAIQGFRNLMRFTGEGAEKILPLLTENPAAALRLDEHKGRIAPGMDADLLILDEQFELIKTFVGGECVYTEGR